MVSVGDKVFVTPLYGQKDNLAVITGPAGGTGAAGTSGIFEGDYNTWTYKWSWALPNGLYDYRRVAFYIDDKNSIFYLWWDASSPGKIRFGVYNIADHSAIFESPTDSDYLYDDPDVYGVGDATFFMGCHALIFSILRSHQTYILLCRETRHTLEVWNAGTKIWTRDMREDTGETSGQAVSAEISLTGKYILFYDYYSQKLWLYEGFDSGTSTGVTETTITDTSKAWVTDALIGHTVYVTSGGADGQSATITGNTGTALTCSAATFVTWGMSTGDTYKVS